MWKPTVSVIMCTYNGEAFLKEQLHSIIEQSYPLLEILIFDDASKDDTVKILEAYAEKFPIIKIHQNINNIGYNANFEQALLKAGGEVIAFADQDDYWLPKKIENMISAWQHNEHY